MLLGQDGASTRADNRACRTAHDGALGSGTHLSPLRAKIGRLDVAALDHVVAFVVAHDLVDVIVVADDLLALLDRPEGHDVIVVPVQIHGGVGLVLVIDVATQLVAHEAGEASGFLGAWTAEEGRS